MNIAIFMDWTVKANMSGENNYVSIHTFIFDINIGLH